MTNQNQVIFVKRPLETNVKICSRQKVCSKNRQNEGLTSVQQFFFYTSSQHPCNRYIYTSNMSSFFNKILFSKLADFLHNLIHEFILRQLLIMLILFSIFKNWYSIIPEDQLKNKSLCCSISIKNQQLTHAQFTIMQKRSQQICIISAKYCSYKMYVACRYQFFKEAERRTKIYIISTFNIHSELFRNKKMQVRLFMCKHISACMQSIEK